MPLSEHNIYHAPEPELPQRRATVPVSYTHTDPTGQVHPNLRGADMAYVARIEQSAGPCEATVETADDSTSRPPTRSDEEFSIGNSPATVRRGSLSR